VARDLIPPPSPAGRPSPDADHERREDAAATGELRDAAQSRPVAPAGPSPFRSRFGFIGGALAGVLIVSGAAFAVLLGTSPRRAGDPRAADHWSSWLPPTKDVFSAPSAIANHVQAEYRRADGKQLVSVHGGPFVYAGSGGLPLPFAIKLEPEDGTILDLGTNGVLYTLTGTGKSGRIVGDKPTAARHRLLRREALELALYSFRYVDSIRMVVALLPVSDRRPKPKAGAQAELQAVFYRPGDLQRQLKSPLAATLDTRTKLKPSSLPAAEAAQIDKLTRRNVFTATFQQQPDGQLYLVLARRGG
jgi:hypothetical protein